MTEMCFDTYIFFFAPFLPPLVRRLFLPTAMMTDYREKEDRDLQ